MRAEAAGRVPERTEQNGSVRSVMTTTDPWPAILIGVGIAVAACLWTLFRRGSIADRARADQQLLDELASPGDEPPVD